MTRDYSHMTDEQLEAHVGMAAQTLTAALENGEPDQEARATYAAALNAYRLR